MCQVLIFMLAHLKKNPEKEVSYNPKFIDFKNWGLNNLSDFAEPVAEKMNSVSLAFFFPNTSHPSPFLQIGLSLASYF